MLEIKKLTKYYGANKKVVGCQSVSFKLISGEITSILGLNGAGKSSIINCITGYLVPDEGSVLLDNVCYDNDEVNLKKRIGVLYEQNPLYHQMSVLDFLYFCAEIHSIDFSCVSERLKSVIEFCELEGYEDRLIRNLSKGYKQRVGLAQAIIHNPELIILDEPTSGLDVPQVKNFEKKLLQISKDKTILLSTHNLRQAAQLCSNHILVNKGKIIAQGNIIEIIQQLETAGCKFESDKSEDVLEQAFVFFAGVNKNEFRKIETA